ncbi:unnamed protein product [Symbiodinium pilosum]|uniref:Uncharacterized protein n=1 Tax=Symbiodinium pilosum TaxID=2952 RepID=A0A812TXI2_SYMPI|nr:unnamed protein product [Symbiodinium pilosum]
MRSPFERLKSHFHRSQVSRGGKWSDFAGWWQWAAKMLASEAKPSCAYSRNFSSYQWSMSDEYHLRPVHKILARAGLRLDKFELLCHVDANPEAASRLRSVKQVIVLRLERLATDLVHVQSLLCSRLLWCRALHGIPRVHTSKAARKTEELAWSAESVEWVKEVYAKDLWLGKYARIPVALPQEIPRMLWSERQ